MHKYYSRKKIREFVEKHKGEGVSISAGMKDNWFWTAEEVWSDGEYKIDVSGDGDLYIAGIAYSYKDSPYIEVEKEGSDEIIGSYIY